jgi:uncharacterized flavoprotein (TIGR03862 family)
VTPTISVFGAGPAGLKAAEAAALGGARVTVFDHMARPGRKLLLAGRGGLNLTHAEPLEAFLTRYSAGATRMSAYVRAFPPSAVRDWAHGLGQETFEGTSRRVFPVAMKASPLLRAWLQRLSSLGVRFVGCSRWVGFSDSPGIALVQRDGAIDSHASDAVVLAFGGKSWPEIGSDGRWLSPFGQAGVDVAPLEASNVGIQIDLPPKVQVLAGQPLKMVDLFVCGQRFRGEAMLTSTGLEGGVIYAAGELLRTGLAKQSPLPIALDLQPNRTFDDVLARLKTRDRRRTLGPWLTKNLGLSVPSARLALSVASSHEPAALAQTIKHAALSVIGLAPIERAISTAGGVAWSELDEHLMVKRTPGTFVAGEMINWDAPTGGYLLQACFATGHAAGLGALKFAQKKGG